MAQSKLPKSILESTLWDKEAGAIWPASTFKLIRNLTRHAFPKKMEAKPLKSVYQTLLEGLKKDPIFSEATLIDTASLDDRDKQYLSEHFLLQHPLEETRSGEGILLSNGGHILAYLNLNDHLCIEAICRSSDWDLALKELTTLEKSLASRLEFAFSSKFGFLTSDPTLCGTGLTIETYLHLPALILSKKLPSLIEDLDDDVLVHGVRAEEVYHADIVIIQNKYTLGVTEDQIMESVHKAGAQLQAAEQKLREAMQKGDDLTLKDRISRAYGLLKNAYQLDTQETLEALSLLKLGCELGFVKGIDHFQTNRLFFHCQSGHLAQLGKDQEESRVRSELFHENLKQLELNIDQA